MSPVDVEITDPYGRRMGRDLVEIPGASSASVEDVVGHATTTILVPFPTEGTYGIRVIPKDDATQDERYSIRLTRDSVVRWIAAESRVGDIPPEGFTTAIDFVPPEIACSEPPSSWQRTDVSVTCTAEDSRSGLANSADARFSLSTSVPDGTETTDAGTNSRSVCDNAGNCATAGPIAGNRVDKKAPTIVVTSPANVMYTFGEAATAAYECTDGGSGIATCAGPVPSGANVDTGSVGSHVFTVNAGDQTGNTASGSVNYTVAYGICVLYDQARAARSGATYPIRLQLCDVNGANVSSPSIPVTATGLSLVSADALQEVQDAGNANPDMNFRYDADLAGYIFNLKTTGLGVGIYELIFTAGSDGVKHRVRFGVR
jgi:hypothetical protein